MSKSTSWMLLVSCALTTACGGGEADKADNQSRVGDSAPEAAAFAAPSGMDTLGTNEVTGVAKRAAVWANSTIPVCWESLAPGAADGRRWTQEAIEGSWESAARIDFTGWGQCQRGAAGVRIQVADEGAQTQGLGKELNGVTNGMRLNFTMNRWNSSCRESAGLEACIRMVGIHEFGHALALAHEQNRPETAEVAGDDCARRRQGTTGDRPLTPWDRSSVMNYCNPL